MGPRWRRECRSGGIARYETYLPCSKDKIKKAFKLVLASLIEHDSLKQKNAEELLGAVSCLDAFVPTDTANRLNQIHQSNPTLQQEDAEYWQYINESIWGLEIRDEIDEFIRLVQALDRKESLFQQRVYTLIGLEYPPAKANKSFWDGFS